MNIALGKCLGNIAGRLHLYHFCSKVGLEALFYRMCYREELKRSVSFFEQHKDRIHNNVEMFSEEKSKNVYLKAIAFRMTHKLKDRPEFCEEEEYFNSLTNLTPKEVLIDCGAYIGDTVETFVSKAGDRYKKIVSFEPDRMNCDKLRAVLRDKHDCLCFEAGVWDQNGELSFREGDLAGSRIEARGGVKVRVMSIDECEECREATFIKMDIEGSELMALRGARQTIKRNRPILTICIYHTDEDMLSILEWMRENLTDYRYYCRHHSYYKEDTIVYAVPNERGREE